MSSSRCGPFGTDQRLGFLSGRWADQYGSSYTVSVMTASRLSVNTLRTDGRQHKTAGLIHLKDGNVCWGAQYVLEVEPRTSAGEVQTVRWVPGDRRKRYFRWHRPAATGPAAQRPAAEHRSRVCEVLTRFDATKDAGCQNVMYHHLNKFDLVVEEREVPDEDGWASVLKNGVSGWVPRSYLEPLPAIVYRGLPHMGVVRLHEPGMTSQAPRSVCVCDCGDQSDLISSARQLFQQLSGQRWIDEENAISVTENEVMRCQFASLGPTWDDRDLWYIVGRIERPDRPPCWP